MADSSSALDVSAGTQHSKDQDTSDDHKYKSTATCTQIEDLKYLYASNVNVSNFVSVKLSSHHKYHVWKVQMVCLMKSQKMGGIVDDKFEGPGTTQAGTIKQYDNLLKGWIFGSLGEDVLINVADLESARAVWEKLKSLYDLLNRSAQGKAAATAFTPVHYMDLDDKRMQESKYQAASNVNVFNFVSEKLSSDGNYPLWKAQMLCLMESQQMRGIVDNLYDDPGATHFKTIKQYDSLLKGWIFGSLTQDLLSTVVALDSASGVWRRLKLIFDHQKSLPQDSASDNPFTQIQIKPVTEKKDNTKRNKKLLKATVEGRWWEAESILKNDKQAATEAITNDGSTMLHFAVGTGQNDFVKELLNFIEHSENIEKKNSEGRTALHIAAVVGNKYAAELLVEKRRELLGIPDNKACVPLLSAYYNVKLDTFVYLSGAADIRSRPRLQLSGFYPGFGFESVASLFITLISTKQYDLALEWVNKTSEVVTKDDQVLMAMAKNFPSDLGLGEILIYPVPAAMFYAVYQLICVFTLVIFYPLCVLYFLLWKVLATIGGPITRIDKKRKDYIKAKKILNLVCDKIDELSFSGPINPYYKEAILVAASQGAHEVVNEILLRSPKTIGSLSKTGHNIIQLAVINRSEKVYNCICHFVERMDLSVKDSSNNNLLHLAGRLAPSFVLSRTTGAALQLQQELQWSKEVKKFMSPTELVEENIHMETPEMVFSKEHKDLVKEGEKWMKTTAESCSITAALITTIVFAAAITVPGGSNQETGIPLFRKEIPFIVFAISDAISLFASSTALLVFLSILTARFSEQDFLVSLPRQLIIGLCTLFLSTIAMMVAFSAVLFLMFCDQRAWMAAIIGGLASLPIAAIITLQFPLVVDLFLSTYYRPIFLADCSKSNMKNMRSSFSNQTYKSSIQLQLQCIMGFKQHASISIKHTHLHRRSSFPAVV